MSESSAELAPGRTVSERLNELEDTVGRLERGGRKARLVESVLFSPKPSLNQRGNKWELKIWPILIHRLVKFSGVQSGPGTWRSRLGHDFAPL